MDSEREAYLLNQERERIFEASRAFWVGDMGPAWIRVSDLKAILGPEPSAD
jgi:hypothetical protein